jgi:hypothetical protein
MTHVLFDLRQWQFVARLSGPNCPVSMVWGLMKGNLRTADDLCNSFANGMRGLQILCNPHPSLFMCQFVQLLQRIFNVCPSNQLLRKLL